MLSACAHMDNGFMRSAQPLVAGKARMSYAISSSYSYAPGLSFQPDSILVLSDREKKADLSCQFPAGIDIGLGQGLQIGGQASVAAGGDYHFRKYEQMYPDLSLTSSLRGYLQKSFPLANDLWIGLSPGILIHNTVWSSVTTRRSNLKHQAIGGEFPVTITKVLHSKDQKDSHSLTFRYTKLQISSRLNVSGPEAWGQHEYAQADQSIKRYALIYTHQLEKSWSGIFMDLGFEFSTIDGHNALAVPIFGFKYYFFGAGMKNRKLE
ncbi:MAG: hypothetical protein PHR32_08695 [Candidatus Cloacimonetes bacterium]|nr:hypothetical protein [Candidatus Cloacimonadota bacterium]